MRLKDNMTLPIYIGRDFSNEPFYIDLARAPHVMMTGKTGSGKYVCLHSIIMSLIRNKTPEELRLLLIDPKMIEFSVYNKIANRFLVSAASHLGVITDPIEALKAICNLSAEVDKRFDILREATVRDIDEYNRKNPSAKLPYIVLIIDEFADLILVLRNAFIQKVVYIASRSRSVGVHIIMSTQRSTNDVIPGMLKALFPFRIAFKVDTSRESRVILDKAGANDLCSTGKCIVSEGPSFDNVNCTMVTLEEIESFCRNVETEISPTVYILPEGEMPEIE